MESNYHVTDGTSFSATLCIFVELKARYCCSCRWGETASLNCAHWRIYCSSSKWYMSMYGETRWYDTDRENQKNSKKNLSQCHFVQQNPTWTDPGANPNLRSEGRATNHLSHSAAFKSSLDQTEIQHNYRHVPVLAFIYTSYPPSSAMLCRTQSAVTISENAVRTSVSGYCGRSLTRPRPQSNSPLL
jgi:hypothetical protein